MTDSGYEIRATEGWPPIAIPGRPGWWRHLINGQQVDLPHRELQSEVVTTGPAEPRS